MLDHPVARICPAHGFSPARRAAYRLERGADPCHSPRRNRDGSRRWRPRPSLLPRRSLVTRRLRAHVFRAPEPYISTPVSCDHHGRPPSLAMPINATDPGRSHPPAPVAIATPSNPAVQGASHSAHRFLPPHGSLKLNIILVLELASGTPPPFPRHGHRAGPWRLCSSPPPLEVPAS